jgi:poly-gamma-glutamate capsule biosynthesis protein CapA/YwtB (metallophosphatase superfamily)
LKITRRSLVLLPAIGWLQRQTARAYTLPPAPPRTRILFGGDVMLSRYVGKLAHEKRDPAWPLHELAGLLSASDIAFVNLESPFSDQSHGSSPGMVFKAEPEMIAALTAAGIDVVSTANNHVRDGGAHGIEFTLDLLAKNGILAVGTGNSATSAHEGAIVARNGVGFGFLGYTFDQSNGNYADQDERVAMLDADQMTADVKRLLGRSDVVIVSMHAGSEYQPQPNPEQQRFARAAIDAGATVVVGHHPHVTQPVETYGRGLIFYSLGNLVFDQSQREETQHGWLADVRFAGPHIAGYGLIPVDIVRTVPRVHRAIR